jgi:GNAT superfamily N-acetyltransferase
MTAINLAKPEDLDRVVKLVADFHAEEEIEQDDATRRAAVLPLLEGSPHGAIYLVGPARAPIGYVAISFGWSIELGGMDGIVDEVFIRPSVRGRGIGSELLMSLPRALAGAGLKALHLEVDREAEKTIRLYEKLHFRPRSRYMLMSRPL